MSTQDFYGSKNITKWPKSHYRGISDSKAVIHIVDFLVFLLLFFFLKQSKEFWILV